MLVVEYHTTYMMGYPYTLTTKEPPSLDAPTNFSLNSESPILTEPLLSPTLYFFIAHSVESLKTFFFSVLLNYCNSLILLSGCLKIKIFHF